MTIQIQLKPEIEARLIAQAATQCLSVEAYLESLIEDSLINQEKLSFYQVSNQEEWENIFTELINSPAFTLAPPLSDAAISRENIYTREDEITFNVDDFKQFSEIIVVDPRSVTP